MTAEDYGGGVILRYGPSVYGKRAEECVRLANLTIDEDIRRELLTLRQTYLRIAERLVDLATREDGCGSPTIVGKPAALTKDRH